MEKVNLADEKTLIKLSEISISLDTYDDIFSDFDPRPYGQRAMSIDFLEEAKRASRDKVSGNIELTFMIPKEKRNKNDEILIKKRLRDHFKGHYDTVRREKTRLVINGLSFVIVSFAIMSMATLLLLKDETSFSVKFMLMILEPAGWFLFWEGLSMMIFEANKKNPDLRFYNKMSKCEIEFIEY